MQDKAIIIVRYENDEQLFIKSMVKLSQYIKVYIYDNSVKKIIINHENIYYYHDNTNGGLAKAINHCVDVAIKDGKEYSVYFDQDSTIDIEMIKSLFTSYKKMKKKYSNLFVIGPQPVMSDGDEYPVKVLEKLDDRFFNASEIITSGMTFKLSDIVNVGYFSLDLFLDMVDFEICWRARSQGMKVIVDKHITMIHEVGNDTIKIPFKILPVSSPIRNYYQTRNVLYLTFYKNKNNFFSILYYVLRRIVNISINMIFADNRLKRFKYNYQGFVDAINKNMGKYNK